MGKVHQRRTSKYSYGCVVELCNRERRKIMPDRLLVYRGSPERPIFYCKFEGRNNRAEKLPI